MKTLLRTALVIAAPAFMVLFFSSCVYDPYSYGTGYSTASVLVSTSSSYWGYDPYRYCYYDYRRKCYYDPYLCGYYRPGYRPPPVTGCPHPRGWRPGHGVCPEPYRPRNHNLSHNLNRLDQLRATNHSWANQVRHNQQSQLAHMRTNQDAWRNRVQAQRTPPSTQAGTTAGRTRHQNPFFGGGRTIIPSGGRPVSPSGGRGGSHGIQGGGNSGHGGSGIQSGNRGHSTRQANLPVTTGRQPGTTQAQAAARARSQAAAAQSRIQAAQSQQRARVQAAQQRQPSSPPPARTAVRSAPSRGPAANGGGGGGRGRRR